MNEPIPPPCEHSSLQNPYKCELCRAKEALHNSEMAYSKMVKARDNAVLRNDEALKSIEGAWAHLEEAWRVIGLVYTVEAIRQPVKEAWKCVRAAKESLSEKRVEPVPYCLCEPASTTTIKKHREGCPLRG